MTYAGIRRMVAAKGKKETIDAVEKHIKADFKRRFRDADHIMSDMYEDIVRQMERKVLANFRCLAYEAVALAISEKTGEPFSDLCDELDKL
jgi:hypothetical protein